MFEPYILIPSELEQPNELLTCLYYSKLKVYWRTQTFITRSIFNDYFANAVISYLDNARTKYQNPNFEAIIIYVHLKGHISPDFFAHCADIIFTLSYYSFIHYISCNHSANVYLGQ